MNESEQWDELEKFVDSIVSETEKIILLDIFEEIIDGKKLLVNRGDNWYFCNQEGISLKNGIGCYRLTELFRSLLFDKLFSPMMFEVKPNDVIYCSGYVDDSDNWRDGCDDCNRRLEPKNGRVIKLIFPQLITGISCSYRKVEHAAK